MEQCYQIGPFLAGQDIADLKHVAPLNAAARLWTFARPGPGSERGLNRVRGRSVKATWSEAHWYRELMALHAETAALFAKAGLAPLDLQNLQKCCANSTNGNVPATPAANPHGNTSRPRRHCRRSKVIRSNGPQGQGDDRSNGDHLGASRRFGSKAADSTPAPDDPELDDTEAPAAADALAYILADIEQRDAAAAAKPQQKPPAEVTPAPNKAGAPPGGNGFSNEQQRHSSAGTSPHGRPASHAAKH